ncbi:MAG: FAD/NAD(P)-binding protein [Nitrospina sp.]|jgi:NAD(P)H-flavin reductase|nr:FAD/NAD(P)-binding protein [Nitrospina sp.]MBT3507968.1 FAD/NAD(P)-binding protein [Nitrospina sp.]MBT3876495.1 FAD/NAD(P)-binding protein [Nitrospina sp.]MBT4048685.1 FAD/NAD(P)-binding protein [Nitrospina sp.]MBT4556926.1 FAD/NAD(P)-binding protein [Nitrospina sp.]
MAVKMDPIIQSPMTPQLYRVEKVIRETHDTFSLRVIPKDDSGARAFQPGQFNMLYAFGVGEVPISISGPKPSGRSMIHTIRDVGTVTHALHGLKKDQTVGLRGPFGSAWPIELAKGYDVVIMAGGIGLAPLRPALYALLEQRDQFGELSLLYGTRKPEDLLFTEEFEEWRGKYGVQVKLTVDTADSEWHGNVGVVNTLVQRVTFDPVNTIAMICGPEVMMRFAVLELKHCGVPEDQIFITMERNMKCAVGFCGHCQFGPAFICKDGPVFRYDQVKQFFGIREI